MILNIILFLSGFMFGMIMMAAAAASGRKSFEEEFYELNKKDE